MGFCTKCGQELVDGKVHICPAAEPETQSFQKNNSRAFKVDGEGETIGVSIDTNVIKERYNTIVNEVSSHVNETKSTIQNENTDLFERNMNIVPDIIKANDGEVPIKQYDIAKLRSRITFAKAEGRLQVTNKRLIFRATGRSFMGKVSLHQEFKINELAGIEFRNRPELNIFNFFWSLIITGLFGGLGFGAVSSSRNDFVNGLIIMFAVLVIAGWIGLAVIFKKINAAQRFYSVRLAVLSFVGGMVLQRATVGSFVSFIYSEDNSGVYKVLFFFIAVLAIINVFLIAFIPNLVIKIKTNSAHSGIEIVKEEPIALLSFLFGKSHDENSGFLEILPWTDTDTAIKELGTLIDDINTLGDMAIEKWKV